MASEDCSIGRGVAAVRHKSGVRSFTYYSMKAIKEIFAKFEAEGTVFGSISKKDFHKLAHIAPHYEVIIKFEHICLPMDDVIERNEEESRTLAALRDALLPKLIRGQIRIADAERFLQERGL